MRKFANSLKPIASVTVPIVGIDRFLNFSVQKQALWGVFAQVILAVAKVCDSELGRTSKLKASPADRVKLDWVEDENEDLMGNRLELLIRSHLDASRAITQPLHVLGLPTDVGNIRGGSLQMSVVTTVDYACLAPPQDPLR